MTEREPDVNEESTLTRATLSLAAIAVTVSLLWVVTGAVLLLTRLSSFYAAEQAAMMRLLQGTAAYTGLPGGGLAALSGDLILIIICVLAFIFSIGGTLVMVSAGLDAWLRAQEAAARARGAIIEAWMWRSARWTLWGLIAIATLIAVINIIVAIFLIF